MVDSASAAVGSLRGHHNLKEETRQLEVLEAEEEVQQRINQHDQEGEELHMYLKSAIWGPSYGGGSNRWKERRSNSRSMPRSYLDQTR